VFSYSLNHQVTVKSYCIPPTYLLEEDDDHLLRTVEMSIYTFGIPRDHIALCASYSLNFLKTLLPFLLLLWK